MDIHRSSWGYLPVRNFPYNSVEFFPFLTVPGPVPESRKLPTFTEGWSGKCPNPTQYRRDLTLVPRTEWEPPSVSLFFLGFFSPVVQSEVSSVIPSTPFFLTSRRVLPPDPGRCLILRKDRRGLVPDPPGTVGTERWSHPQSRYPPSDFTGFPGVSFPCRSVRTFSCNSVVPFLFFPVSSPTPRTQEGTYFYRRPSGTHLGPTRTTGTERGSLVQNGVLRGIPSFFRTLPSSPNFPQQLSRTLPFFSRTGV